VSLFLATLWIAVNLISLRLRQGHLTAVSETTSTIAVPTVLQPLGRVRAHIAVRREATARLYVAQMYWLDPVRVGRFPTSYTNTVSEQHMLRGVVHPTGARSRAGEMQVSQSDHAFSQINALFLFPLAVEPTELELLCQTRPIRYGMTNTRGPKSVWR
jgi:hypothetical protein